MKTKKTTNKKTAPKHLTVLEEVKQLYKFMEDNKLSALDYANKGTHVKLVRAGMSQSVEGTLNNFSFQPKEETKKEVPVYDPNENEKKTGCNAYPEAVIQIFQKRGFPFLHQAEKYFHPP